MAFSLSEIRVGFEGDGAGVGELTWGQMGIWRASQRTGRTMNLTWGDPLPEGTSLAELAGRLRFQVSRHPALRTRLRFAAGPSGSRHPRQVVAGSGEVPLEIADVDDDDDVERVVNELRSRYELTHFDYENEFPVRMGVVRQSGVPRKLVVCYSHVMLDGGGLEALRQDLKRLDRATAEATAPPEGMQPLELARRQGSPALQRQSDRAVRYWAAQIERLSAWRPSEPASPQEQRFWQLKVYSPAMELGMRAVAARTGVDTTSVLIAAYSLASARVLGRNPSVVQISASNRFRPGLACMVSQVSQHGICVVDAADATFDEVLARAHRAATRAAYYAYYDPVACDKALDEIAARRGQSLDIYWCLNDRRAMGGPAGGCGDGGAPTEAELTGLLPRTEMYWHRKEPASDGTLFIHVDSHHMPIWRPDLADGPPAVFGQVWTDTHHFALDQVKAFAHEMEAVVIAVTR